MKIAVLAALAFGLGAGAAAHADQVIVLNSEEASYSVLSRGMRAEIVRPLVSRYEVRLLETRGRLRKGMLVRIGPEALLPAERRQSTG